MTTHTERLLPHEAYEGFTMEQMLFIDEQMMKSLHQIPITPGFYKDKTGDTWLLKDTGVWQDHKGETRDSSWTPLLSLFAPWTPCS